MFMLFFFFSLSSSEPLSNSDAADSAQAVDAADFETVADTVAFPDVSFITNHESSLLSIAF